MDWDSAHVPVLTDLDWKGRRRKLLLWADKNGLMYVLDRASGEFLSGKPFVEVNWMQGFDSKGRPILVQAQPARERRPSDLGGTNWHPPSYSPVTNLFYVPARERHEEGPGNAYGAIRAFDPITGEMKWEFRRNDAIFGSGVLTTASGLLFTGAAGDFFSGPVAARVFDGHFYGLDARNGEPLWKIALPGGVQSSPVTYVAGGRQYVVVNAAGFLFAFALRP
jgi:alcohol dehydrogenase (cytochrome c)